MCLDSECALTPVVNTIKMHQWVIQEHPQSSVSPHWDSDDRAGLA